MSLSAVNAVADVASRAETPSVAAAMWTLQPAQTPAVATTAAFRPRAPAWPRM